MGDLGNVEANENGIVNITLLHPFVSLFGQYSILGRSVVIHEKPDALGRGGHATSNATGNAGACGIIGIAKV